MNKWVYAIDSYIRVTKETKYLVLELCSSFAGLILLYVGTLVHESHTILSFPLFQTIISSSGFTIAGIGIIGFLTTLALGNYTRYKNNEGVDRTFLVSGPTFGIALLLIWPISIIELIGYGFGFIMLIHIFVSAIRIGLSFYKSAEYGQHIDPPPSLSEIKQLQQLPSNPALRKLKQDTQNAGDSSTDTNKDESTDESDETKSYEQQV